MKEYEVEERKRMSERSRKMYYIDGSTARVMTVPERRERNVRRVQEEEYVEHQRPARTPERQTRPEQHKQRKPAAKRRISPQAERALAFNFKYTVYVTLACVIMACAGVVLLTSEAKLTKQRQNIANLEAELKTITDDNAAYKIKLDNMYSLDQVYDIATNELGMVYAKKGQIVYYDGANEDYVKQYRNVPSAD